MTQVDVDPPVLLISMSQLDGSWMACQLRRVILPPFTGTPAAVVVIVDVVGTTEVVGAVELVVKVPVVVDVVDVVDVVEVVEVEQALSTKAATNNKLHPA